VERIEEAILPTILGPKVNFRTEAKLYRIHKCTRGGKGNQGGMTKTPPKYFYLKLVSKKAIKQPSLKFSPKKHRPPIPPQFELTPPPPHRIFNLVFLLQLRRYNDRLG
jgi:hypothetical protein